MYNISFWLDYCLSEKSYPLLKEYGYAHDWVKHGDIGGLNAKISGQFFERHEDGDFMIAQAVWYDTPSPSNIVEEPDLQDIIAWHPERPDKWYFLRGEAGLVLGEKPMFRSNIFHEPLRIHSSPFEWLKSGRIGSCLLDQHGLNRLYGLNEVICDNINHGTRIELGLSMYYRKNMPRISVPKENRI